MLRGDISTGKEKAACEPIGEDPEIAASGRGHKRGERERRARGVACAAHNIGG